MYGRRQIAVCREGWYYLFVLAFILGGAILRQINPLFVLSGLMIAPLLFNWRLAMSMIRNLSVRRNFPDQVAAGQPLVIDFEVDNQRTRVDTWSLCITDQMKLIEPETVKHPTKVEAIVTHVGCGQKTITSYRCYFSRRGKYQLGPVTISTRFPIGLLQAKRRIGLTTNLIVSPRIGKLTPSWSRIVQSKPTGSQQAVHAQGMTEGDYYALRQWQSGDSRRWIHWRTSARVGDLMVRQFERQSDREVVFVLDLWQDEAPSSEQQDAVELAVSMAATAVVNQCKESSGHLTLAIAGNSLATTAGTSNAGLQRRALRALALTQATQAPPLRDAFVEIMNTISLSSQIVVISTRNAMPTQLRQELDAVDGPAWHQEFLERIAWIDVTAPGLERIYQVD